MNMTKRDLADIVFVLIAASFIMSLVDNIVVLGTHIGMNQESQKYMNKSVAVVTQTIAVIVLLLLSYVLLFKRSYVLDLLFPDGKDKEISIPSGMESLIHYVFWIRIFGFFIFLSSGVHFFTGLVIDVSSFSMPPYTWFYAGGGKELLSSIMGLFIIYKAEWIVENFVENKIDNN